MPGATLDSCWSAFGDARLGPPEMPRVTQAEASKHLPGRVAGRPLRDTGGQVAGPRGDAEDHSGEDAGGPPRDARARRAWGSSGPPRDAKGQAGGVVGGLPGEVEDPESEGLRKTTRPGARGPARRGVG